MARPVSDVELVFWDGGCALFGSSSGSLPLHAHQAIQIAFGRSGIIRVRASDDGPWLEHAISLVASKQPHAFDATDVPIGVVLWLEPETREGRALTELYLTGGLTEVDRAPLAQPIEELFDAYLARRGEEVVVGLIRRIVQMLTQGVEPLVISDPRILRAVAWINAHLNRPIQLDQVAAEVFLSSGRFRHLFVEQTGMGLRPYILWRRFIRIWELTMAGSSLSRAAHEAGFADSAHLTRTSRRMIGIAPSMLRVSRSPASLREGGGSAAAP